jgi:hypothetical protein
MENVPVTEMLPTITKSGEGKGNEGLCFVFAKPDHTYLGYTLNKDQLIRFNLTGDKDYKIELIDTWNMKIQNLGTSKPGTYTYRTTDKYQALSATRK